MVIVHVFLRTIRKTEYVMVDVSTDSWSKPLFASPEALFEAVGTAKRWEPRVKQAIEARFPELTAGLTCWPNDTRTGNIRCFDIPFYEKGEPSWTKKLNK
jgi:hypothetical protein